MTRLINDTKLKKQAVLLSVSFAILLSVIKFFAFLSTGSLAVFSSFVDSITDLLASLISFVAVYFTSKPANSTHKYGFGKTEAVSALFQAVFVAISGIFIIIDGVKRLINPIVINKIDIALNIMIFSVIATLFLVSFQIYVAKKTNSLAIKADMAHYSVDLLTNSAVILSLLFVYFFDFTYFDSIAALFISFYLLFNAYKLTKESIELIIDKELPDDIKKDIEDIALSCNGVLGVHDFRSRNLGSTYFFEIHLEIDGNKSLYEAHKISDSVENKILNKYHDSQIVIHQDPYGIKEVRLDHTIEGSCPLS